MRLRHLYDSIFILMFTTVYYYSMNPCVNDTTAPIIFCPASKVTVTDPGSCTAIIGASSLSYPIFFDACGATIAASGIPPGYAFPVGSTTITWTATDAAGNSSSCTQTVTVSDAENPIINCPSNITAYTTAGQCNANVNVPLAIASDNCSISSITNNYNSGGANASGTYPLGVTTVTFIATDSAGRSASCNLNVTVINSQSPVITLSGFNTLTIEACDTYTEFGATATDTCLGDISSSILIDTSALNTSAVGTYVVTYNVLGATQVSRTINVIDTTNPTLTLVGPNPLTIGDCATFTELGAMANDPCFGDISSSILINNSSVNPGVLGSYTVTYNVTDASGNSAQQITRTVNVIDVNNPEIILNGDNPQIVEACTPYVELGATATDPCFGTDISGNLVIDTSAINLGVPGSYDVTYNVTDAYGNAAIEVIRTLNVVDTTIIANAGNDVTNSICSDTTVILEGNSVSGSATGLWSVTSSQLTGFSFSDPTSPRATFVGDVGEIYELTWSINNPCVVSSDTINVTFVGCNALDFDGVDDNVSFNDNYNFSGDFSIEVWIKSDITNNNTQTIISKRESNNQIDGYDLRLVNNYISFHWNNGKSLTSAYPITTNIWHHLAVTFGNGTYRLYMDGIQVNNASGVVPTSNTFDCIVGAMDQTTNPPFKPTNYFDGGMDELRIWNVALSSDQIHKMMNQEIENNYGIVIGSVIPQDVSGLTWNNLNGYYQMNQSTDLSSGYLVSNSASAIDGKLRYMTSLQPETAPLPYISKANGLWTNSNSWLYGNSQTIPNSMGVDGITSIDWNIVRTSHNMSSGNNNITLLGLDIINNTLSIENTNPIDGHSLRITDYLKIDGILNLVGESQLLQDMGSMVDYSGIGTLHRNQQGTSNLYNYNYWGSPVSLNGSDYSLGSILYDGTQPVLWTTARDANPGTTPITLSNRWLYLYQNYPINSYADWQSINQNSTVQVGLGFLMKGSGASTSNQNFTFVGKPNNGTITSPIAANFEALVGNPYPSAIDANEFILDNSSSTQGALYFWEHYSSNATHILKDYQGGFAVYNLSGGIAAVSPPEISSLGAPSKIPERYIPVAQGFNVNGNATGGSVLFENDQRVFVKEAATGGSNSGSVFMKESYSKNKNSVSNVENNIIKRLRINFKAPNDAIRPLLLAFVPNNLASDRVDYGYDALNSDQFPNDISWIIEDEKYIIQGVGEFDKTKQYPFGVFLLSGGNIEISLIDLENFDSDIDVFVFDALLGTYTKIDALNIYTNNLDIGDYLDRFFITFIEKESLSVDDLQIQQMVVNYLNDTNEIYLKVPPALEVKQIHLINILGQTMNSWKTTNTLVSSEYKFPVRFISEGTYIIKVETTSGIISKKVVVKHL